MESKRPRVSFFKRESDANSQSEPQETAPEGRSEKSFDSPKPKSDRPYDKDRKPFDRDKKPFDREKRSFDKGDKKPFDRDRKPFDRDKKPFGKDRFDKGDRKSYGNDRRDDRKSFGDRKPFDRDRKPYGDDRRGGYGGSGEDRGDRKPRYEDHEPLQAPENLIFGIHPVKEALEAGQALEKLYVKKDTENAEGIIEYAESRGIPVQYVPIEKLDKLTKRNNHQGVVAVVPAIEYADFNQVLEDAMAADKPAMFIVLDSITDVRNFGAIARSAECVGADAIIIPAKNAAPINAEAMKTSVGALATLPVCRVGSLRNTLKTMQLAGVQLVAATEKSTELLYETDLCGSVAIVMGSEDAGISLDVLRICDKKVSIPMLGKIESLNVSAAAAVLMYEVVRQRFEKM